MLPLTHLLVPTTYTQSHTHSVGDACTVKWSDGEEYDATVLAMGEGMFTCTCV